MKKVLFTAFILISSLAFLGCQEVETKAEEARNFVDDTTQKVDATKKQVEETKAKIDQKVEQAKDAADAMNKFLNE